MSGHFKYKNKLFTSSTNFVNSFDGRISILENNEYKITYYQIISGTSGTITPPTGATFNEGEFGSSGNAILSKVTVADKPTFQTPVTSGGAAVTVSLNISTGVYVCSGVYTDAKVALIYSINISAANYSNLNNFYIVETELLSGINITTPNAILLSDNSNQLAYITPGANQSIRRNSANTAYEAYTPFVASGTTAQYIRGDGSLATFPTAVSSFTNDSGYLTSGAIGVTIQGYSANTTLLGNTTTGSGSIVLATSPTISQGLTLSFLTANRIPFSGVGGALSDSSQLIWDASTTRLGVGGAPSSTSAKAEFLADATRFYGAWFRAHSSGVSFPFAATADSAGRAFLLGSSSFSPTSIATTGCQFNIGSQGATISGLLNIGVGVEGVLALQTGSGVVVVGGTTNAGFKLDVVGTARVSGALRIGNTVHTVSPTSPNRTIEIVVGGTTYYIHAKTTND